MERKRDGPILLFGSNVRKEPVWKIAIARPLPSLMGKFVILKKVFSQYEFLHEFYEVATFGKSFTINMAQQKI